MKKTKNSLFIGIMSIFSITSLVGCNKNVEPSVSHNVTNPTTQSHIIGIEELKPVNDEIFDYCNGVSCKDDDMPYAANIGNLYEEYKHNDIHGGFSNAQKTCQELNFMGGIHNYCYFVDKDIIGKIDDINSIYPDDLVFPDSGLYKYVFLYKCGFLSEEEKNKGIYYCEIDDSIDNINSSVKNLYLIDIVKFFKEESYQNHTFIDTVPYTLNNGDSTATIDIKNIKHTYKYLYFRTDLPTTFDSFLNKRNHSWIYTVDVLSTEIAFEKGIYIIKDLFGFRTDYESSYYDDINDCIIEKEFIKSNCLGNGCEYSYDLYEVTFDYSRILVFLNGDIV